MKIYVVFVLLPFTTMQKPKRQQCALGVQRMASVGKAIIRSHRSGRLSASGYVASEFKCIQQGDKLPLICPHYCTDVVLS
jgi:hypothetical protein